MRGWYTIQCNEIMSELSDEKINAFVDVQTEYIFYYNYTQQIATGLSKSSEQCYSYSDADADFKNS